MNKIRFLVLMCILGAAGIVNAQQQVSEIEARNAAMNMLNKDTTTTNKNIEREKKISYSFFTEFGLSAGTFLSENPPFVEITGIFVNSICFNKKQDMIGIGVGCELFYVVMAATLPIFVNYRHNFSSKTNFKPLINVALGTRIGIEGWGWGGYGYGLYSTIAGGFRYKSLSFNAGIFVKSLNDGIFIKSLNDGNYSGGVEIKIGYIFLK
jgi:hypothetical protein